MRLHVYAQSHVHYSRRNAQLLYLSISQGSIGVLVFFHHITGGVRVSGGGDGEGGAGGGKSAVLSQEPSFLVLCHPSLWFCLLPFDTQRRAGRVILRYKTLMRETCGSCRAGGRKMCLRRTKLARANINDAVSQKEKKRIKASGLGLFA